MVGPQFEERRKEAFIRFSLADPASCVQLALSHAAGLKMPAMVNIRNIWVTTTSLYPSTYFLCKTFKTFSDNTGYAWKDALALLMPVMPPPNGLFTIPLASVAAAVDAKIASCTDPSTFTIGNNVDVYFHNGVMQALNAMSAQLKATSATHVSTCCGTMLTEEEATSAAYPHGCMACSRPFDVSKLVEPLQQAGHLGVRNMLAHALGHLMGKGHTRIMVLWSADATRSVFSERYGHDDDIYDFMKEITPSCTVEIAGNPNALNTFNNATGVSIIGVVGHTRNSSAMVGVDIPQCDAVVALGRAENEEQAYSRALRVSATPRAELPVVRLFYPGWTRGSLPPMITPSPKAPQPLLPGTATFVTSILETLNVSATADMDQWAQSPYDHSIITAFTLTFRGAGYERLVVNTPAIEAVDGIGIHGFCSVTFTFCSLVKSECVPTGTRGITFRANGDAVQFEWMSAASPDEAARILLPVANCERLEVEAVLTVKEATTVMCATAIAVEDEAAAKTKAAAEAVSDEDEAPRVKRARRKSGK